MLFFQAILVVLVHLSSLCESSLIVQDRNASAANLVLLNQTSAGAAYRYKVPGTTTTVQFVTLRDAHVISAPDTYMMLNEGLFALTKLIAARGGKSYVGSNEMEYERDRAFLQMKHSDEGPGAMKLSVFSDLLFAIANAMYSHGLHVEVQLDVWEEKLHVAVGWLSSIGTPRRKLGAEI